MDKENRPQRLEKAISYLVNNKMIDGTDIVKEISEKVDRHPNNVRSALRGEERYLTYKFIKSFCMIFGGVISPDWIWEGSGEMLTSKTENVVEHIDVPENINKMEKSQLVSLLTSMIETYNKILDNNRNLLEHIRLCEEIARQDQDKFKYLMSQIENVSK